MKSNNTRSAFDQWLSTPEGLAHAALREQYDNGFAAGQRAEREMLRQRIALVSAPHVLRRDLLVWIKNREDGVEFPP